MKAQHYLSWLLLICRSLIGGLVVYSGAQLLRGEGLLSNSRFDSLITGIFIIILGLYCILSSILPKIIK